MTRRSARKVRADTHKARVIHSGRPAGRLMFAMAAAAILDRGVEGSRLLGQIRGGVGVTFDAGLSFNAARRRMTRFALAVQKSMLLGEGTGLKTLLPSRNRGGSGAIERRNGRAAGKQACDDQQKVKGVEWFHDSHRSP